MRRARKNNPITVFGITLAAVVSAGAIFCVCFITDPLEKLKIEQGGKVEAHTVETKKAVQKTSSGVEIVTPSEDTLNQEEKKTKISASRQSSLEKAVDDLIELTESDG